jgi:hypothetical protein
LVSIPDQNTTRSSTGDHAEHARRAVGLGAHVRAIGNGPDSWWVPFTDDANAGFSLYGGTTEGTTGHNIVANYLWPEVAKHDGSWAEAEGTNTYGAPDGSSDVDWETYLARIFNHGGTLANLFGGFVASGGYALATDSDDAAAAYRKFLGASRSRNAEVATSVSS